MKKLFFQQQSHWDCGLSCLAIAHYIFYQDVSIGKRIFYQTDVFQALNLLQLEKVASAFQMQLNSFESDWESFKTLKIETPIILPTQIKKQNHYLIVLKKRRNWYLIGDPGQEDFEWWEAQKLKPVFKNVLVFVKSQNPQSKQIRQNKSQSRKNLLLIKILIAGSFSTLILTVLNLAVQFGMKKLIEETFFLKITENLSLLLGVGILFLSQTIMTILWKAQLIGWQIMYAKRQNKRFFAVLHNLSWTQFAKQTSLLIWRKYHDLQIVNEYQIAMGLAWIQGFYLILGSTITLMLFDFWITIPVLIITLINALINSTIWPKQQRNLRKLHWKEQNLTHQIQNNLKEWKEWKGRQLWAQQNTLLLQQVNKNIDLQRQNFWYQIFNQISDQQIRFWSQLCLIYVLKRIFFQHNLTAAQLLFILALSSNVFTESQTLFAFWIEHKKIRWLKQELANFLEGNKPQSAAKNEELRFPKELKIKQITLRNLNFSYNDYDWLWKEDLTYCLKNHVLIQGQNGSGKSTFLTFFSNFDLNYKGDIYFNNWKWRQIARQTQKKVIYLNSNPQLLPKTIADNIFVYTTRLPDQLKGWMATVLQRHNLNWTLNCAEQVLSAGQRQIIVFLSLFGGQQTVYLLDESLNAVANPIKTELLTKFLKLKSDKVVLYVSHDKQAADLPFEVLTLG